MRQPCSNLVNAFWIHASISQILARFFGCVSPAGQTLDTLTLPKKMYLWQSNLSDIYVSLCDESHCQLYRDYYSSLQ